MENTIALTNLITKSLLCFVAVITLPLFAGSAVGQTRDHLTDAETDLIRFHQELDKRIEVFIKAIDRRFEIINGVADPKMKKVIKGEPDWGDAPKGTRAELIGDIAGILDEAITNIDDVSRRDEKSPLISRSLRRLSTAATGYATQLTAMSKQTKDNDELSAIERALDNANDIIAAGNKLPPPAPSNKKSKP
jgi:hypothetical protein